MSGFFIYYTPQLQASFSLIKQIRAQLSPLSPLEIIIQNQNLKSWFQKEYAQWSGIASNFSFFTQDEFLRKTLVPEETTTQGEKLKRLLFLYHLLRDEAENLSPLLNYLTKLPSSKSYKRLDLAKQLLMLQDSYDHSRPELIHSWSNDKLLTSANHPSHSYEKLQYLIFREMRAHFPHPFITPLIHKRLKKRPDPKVNQSPLIIIGSAFMAELALEFCLQESNHRPIYYFLQSPSLILPSIEKSPHPEEDPTGHFLESTGKIGKDLLFRLSNAHEEGIKTVEQELQTLDLNSKHTLNYFQKALFSGDNTPQDNILAHSLHFFECSDPKREVETALSLVLHSLEEDPSLDYSDIAISCTDIDTYQPFIKSIFNSNIDPLIPNIPLSISGEKLDSQKGLINSFLNFLKLPLKDFPLKSIEEIFETQGFHSSHYCENTTLLDWIELMKELGVSKGWFSSPEGSHGISWPHAFKLIEESAVYGAKAFETRHAIHYFQPQLSSTMILEILEWQSWFQELAQQLLDFSKNKNTLSSWGESCIDLLEQFFPTKGLPSKAKSEKQTLEGLCYLFTTTRNPNKEILLDYEEFLTFLDTELLQKKNQPGGFHLEGIQISDPRSLRGIPFKVHITLGLNENRFPSSDTEISLDLKNISKPHLLDATQKEVDLYSYLETLQQTQNKYYGLYSRRDMTSQKEIMASPLITETLSCLNYLFPKQKDSFLIKSPLTGLSPENFQKNHFPKSYFSCHFQALNKTNESPSFNPRFSSPQSLTLHTEDLFKFIKDPYHLPLKHKLNLSRYKLPQEEKETPLAKLSSLDELDFIKSLYMEGAYNPSMNAETKIDEAILYFKEKGKVIPGSLEEFIKYKLQSQSQQTLQRLEEHSLKNPLYIFLGDIKEKMRQPCEARTTLQLPPIKLIDKEKRETLIEGPLPLLYGNAFLSYRAYSSHLDHFSAWLSILLLSQYKEHQLFNTLPQEISSIITRKGDSPLSIKTFSLPLETEGNIFSSFLSILYEQITHPLPYSQEIMDKDKLCSTPEDYIRMTKQSLDNSYSPYRSFFTFNQLSEKEWAQIQKIHHFFAPLREKFKGK